MSQSNTPLFENQDIDQYKLSNIVNEFQHYSASFSERTIISKLEPLISPILPLEEKEIRNLFFLVFKTYNGSNNPPLQKLALLEGEERVEPLKYLKNTIVDVFASIFIHPDKIEKVGNRLEKILQRYFQRICSYFD